MIKSKFVLNEPPKWTNRTVDIAVKKPANSDDKMEVFHGDSGEKVCELVIEQKTRNIVILGTGSTRLIVKDDVGNMQLVGTAGQASEPVKLEPGELPRSWEIRDTEDGKVFAVTLNNITVELPVVDPGPLTPTDKVHEVFGQDHMLFTLALALKLGKHSMLSGPTGIGKTTVYRWLAQKLGYNLVAMPIARGTQDRHLTGEYAPAGQGLFEWMDGPVTVASRASQTHPTILVFEELNRIGNVAEFSRIYSLLDDTKMLELPERRIESGEIENIKAGQLFVGGTSNPVDDENADYMGVKELDPAFNNRFPLQPKLAYPDPKIEAAALQDRVDSLDKNMALKMVESAKRVREAHEVRFPMSFRELEAWAMTAPFYGYDNAAEVSVISKAPQIFRPDIRRLLRLQGAPAIGSKDTV